MDQLISQSDTILASKLDTSEILELERIFNQLGSLNNVLVPIDMASSIEKNRLTQQISDLKIRIETEKETLIDIKKRELLALRQQNDDISSQIEDVKQESQKLV